MRESMGARIKRQREALGLSQRRLASLATVSPGHITRLESGSRGVRVEADTLRKVAGALGKSERWVRAGEESGDADLDNDQYSARAAAIVWYLERADQVVRNIRTMRFSGAETFTVADWREEIEGMSRRILRTGEDHPLAIVGASVLEDDGEEMPITKKRAR